MSAARPYQSSFDFDRKPAVILDINRGKQLAKIGMELARETAERKEKGWSKRTWQLFLFWIRYKKKGTEFMMEEFRKRMYELDLLEPPPSERAYGFLSVRARNGGWIEFVRTEKVKNPKAHSANAAVWRKK